MNNKKQRLELTWIGKYDQPVLEPRILLEDPNRSYPKISLSEDINELNVIKPIDGSQLPLNFEKNTPFIEKSTLRGDNLLIHGDNLLALKALEQDFAGKVKCIYIDPPYNTGNAFEHYDDGLEHSQWLNLMKPRIELLRTLLSDDGSIWISIDDDESHYLKVMCDEVFGRINFVANVIWEKKYSPQNDAKWLSDSHDHILVYAKNKDSWRPNLLPRTDEMNDRYRNPDNDPRGVWMSDNLSVKTYSASCDYPITTPGGKIANPPAGYCWRVSKTKLQELIEDNRIWFGKDGNSGPRLKRFLSDVKDGSVSKTIWKRDEVGDNQDAKREVKEFNSREVFATPKPERLLERILTLSTKEGDLILDSFLGSGTTAAVAHKMNRRWIGIEMGEHCYTHCIPRLQKVIDGSDQGGISKAVNWQGGGSFKFYELAPSLLKKDEHDNWIIEPKYNATMLAAALAKHEGYKYNPDENKYWKQGYSSEKDFIFTTTQFLTTELLDRIYEDMENGESLLICTSHYHGSCKDKYSNITIKKIPQMLLGRCEFGKEDYSLSVINLPEIPEGEITE